MPKDFTWGPGREKSTATGRGTFFPATPQVFYSAYILIAFLKNGVGQLPLYLVQVLHVTTPR